MTQIQISALAEALAHDWHTGEREAVIRCLRATATRHRDPWLAVPLAVALADRLGGYDRERFTARLLQGYEP